MSFHGIVAHIEHDEAVITTMQRRKKINPLVVIRIFQKYQHNPDLFEELKNQISDDRDYYDLVDLIDALPLSYHTNIMNIIRSTRITNHSPYATQIMADIDNTTIENYCIAPVQYQNKAIVPGIMTLLKYFSRGKTTVSFISARPRIIERKSIQIINNLVSKQLRFTFLTGEIHHMIKYGMGRGMFSDQVVESSYIDMAQKKYTNYLALKQVFPYCRFIFLGDDTQGDPYLADMLTNSSPHNFAAIRMIAGRKLPTYILQNPRIYFHTSYFALIHVLISIGLINHTEILPMLQFEMDNQYNPMMYLCQNQVAKDMHYYKLIVNSK